MHSSAIFTSPGILAGLASKKSTPTSAHMSFSFLPAWLDKAQIGWRFPRFVVRSHSLGERAGRGEWLGVRVGRWAGGRVGL